MSEEEFKEKFGRLPVDDELERINCVMVGENGHWYCGWCSEHDQPRFRCNCHIKSKEAQGDE